MVEYDPYTQHSKIIKVPGLSNSGKFTRTAYHGNGIDYDPSTGHIFYALASAGAFENNNGDFSHNNLTGDNQVWIYDAVKGEFLWHVNLGPAQEAFLQKTKHQTSGFQDIAEDYFGNAYAMATFGNAIVKIDHKTRKPSLWWSASDHSDKYGFGGLFSLGNKLVVSDAISGGLVTLDLATEPPCSTYVPLENLPKSYRLPTADGLFAPSKYAGKIALWSDDYNGTAVLGSHDHWRSAHFLGEVRNHLIQTGGFTVATFEIGERIFSLSEYFQATLPQVPRDKFPVVDISTEVDNLVRRFLRN